MLQLSMISKYYDSLISLPNYQIKNSHYNNNDNIKFGFQNETSKC